MEIKIDAAKIAERGLMICLPCYGGVMSSATARGLMDLSSVCASNGIKLKTFFINNESLVQRARNFCTDVFMQSDCNTMVFIDADIDFQPLDVLALVHIQNEDPEKFSVIGGPYPKKHIDWNTVAKAVNKGFGKEKPEELENFVGSYVLNFAEARDIRLDEPVEVLETGTGFMVIARETFDKFREAYPEQEYTPDHLQTENWNGSRNIHAYFDCVICPDTKRYLSEDYYFCQNVRKAGMKVWLAPWIRLGHNGNYTFKGNMSALAAIG